MNRIKEEMPRERLEKLGPKALKSEELIAIILKTGTKKSNVLKVSRNIIEDLKEIKNLKRITYQKLIRYEGIGKAKALELISAIEIGRRVFKEDRYKAKIKLNSADKVFKLLKEELANKKQEHFYCLYLDNIKNLVSKKLLFIGSIDQSIVHPREVFLEAYKNYASAVICVHNHPSGKTNPSKEDIITTRKLKEAGNILGIKLLDHIIISENGYYSFMEMNNM